ncbi:hypothetical protein QJS10_CPA02g00559 [Acorus calamus]|uniref:TMEM205-like domain-containing protein n=1 Tax=Acorus calamus TaxID=4465 RepID=A0AAV9FBE5_ACOCL|nr:hypothetical protein QJS10_CPA02g00559 [Acorus calamus]
MNVVAIGLVLTTLATAGVWSPPPDKVHRTNGGDDVVLREGHRLIVVEYEKQGLKKQPTTTTQQQEAALPRDSGTQHEPERHGLVEEAKEKFKETASVLPNLGQGVSDSVHGTKEKICDAYGVCKDKLASVFAKENVTEAARGAVEKARGNLTEMARRARELGRDLFEYVLAGETVRAAAEVVRVLGFAVAYGACVWVTFVSSHVLAGALPRQQLGVVMFERMKVEKEEGRGRDLADMIGEPVATTTTFTGIASPSGRSFATRETTTTTSATTTTGVASADQEKVKQRLVRLSRRLGKLNSYSSFLNVLSLMGLTWHLVYLAGRLQVASC